MGGGGGGGVVEEGHSPSGAKTEKTNSSYKVTEGGRECFQCTRLVKCLPSCSLLILFCSVTQRQADCKMGGNKPWKGARSKNRVQLLLLLLLLLLIFFLIFFS